MSIYTTNDLLDLCRNGIRLKNTSTDTAACELASYIVFASLLEDKTEVSDELDLRIALLIDAATYPSKYLQDIFEEDECALTDEPPFEPSPLVA